MSSPNVRRRLSSLGTRPSRCCWASRSRSTASSRAAGFVIAFAGAPRHRPSAPLKRSHQRPPFLYTLAMSALDGILRECPVAQLGRDEADQAADAKVWHLVALHAGVDPGARHFEEVRRLARIPQPGPELLCCVHGV